MVLVRWLWAIIIYPGLQHSSAFGCGSKPNFYSALVCFISSIGFVEGLVDVSKLVKMAAAVADVAEARCSGLV